ncbi:MAG: hypothetical protein QGH39_06945 [Candidatus Thermoplasmatota archaeon]|nr:hypothetical protein [Candidatus Thermoplasmatota archaeon]MDP7265281.1 hypothetical protein [Candidatus Thermoplasmatota archaeon]
MNGSVERRKRVPMIIKKFFMISVLFLILLTTANVSAQRNSDCSSCHSIPDPSDGYVYDTPVVFINVPLFVDLDEDFIIEAGVDFNEYEIKELSLTIAQDQEILKFENTKIKSTGIDERTSFTFKATTIKLGVCKISITAKLKVYFDHVAGDDEDY